MPIPIAESRPAGSLIRAAIGACRSHLIHAGLFSAIINFLYLAPTIYMLQVYDRVVPTRGVSTLVFLTLLLLCSLATLSLLDLTRSRLLVRASARLEKLLAGPILRASLSRQLGGKGTQAMRDFDSLRQTLTGAGVLALFDAPWTPVYIGICFLLHPMLGVMAVVGSAALIGLTLLNERITRPYLDRANWAAAWSYTSQAQTVAARDVVRALGMGDAMVRRHQDERLSVTGAQAEASLTAGRYLSLTRFIRISLQSLGLGLAAYLAMGQQISAGAIFAASLLIARALSPIEQILGSWKSLAEAHSAYGSLEALLDGSAVTAPRTLLPKPTGRLSVEHLTVFGTVTDRPLLQNVSFSMAPGTVLGLIGPSGAGKTTLLRALMGAQALSQGKVRLDDADVTDWDPDRLGRHFGYLPQDISLLQGTVKENICRFRSSLDEHPEKTDAKVIAAARACGVHEMILSLPLGYDTVLDWGGKGVSLGQAQRIALARALYDDPVFVALDEPNAHLDGEGESKLLSALQALKSRGAAVIIVAHRLSMLVAMDQVLVLSEGRVAQYGDRDEVVRVLNAPVRRVPDPVHQREVA
jgi:PrtD family type I secretion system ABC transporter